MRALIVFFSKSGKTKSVAEAIALGLKEKNFEVDFAPLETAKKKSKSKSVVELLPVQTDLSSCDLVVFGSPVFGLSPKRKISKAVEAFLRQCTGLDGKKTVVFLTCFGISGTALKKITGMIQARGASVADSLIVAYLLGISAKQLEQAREFGKKIAGALG